MRVFDWETKNGTLGTSNYGAPGTSIAVVRALLARRMGLRQLDVTVKERTTCGR